jgi:hypothetical protein
MASLSLGKTLASVMRRGVPEQAFEACALADRLLLENVAHLAQQAVPELDVTRAAVRLDKDVYVLRIPASISEVTVDLSQLREIEAYSPFRIVQVGVKLEKEGASVEVRVATENRPLAFSEVDIVRITKRRRFV